MDARLQSLLYQYHADPSPENAVAFVENLSASGLWYRIVCDEAAFCNRSASRKEEKWQL